MQQKKINFFVYTLYNLFLWAHRSLGTSFSSDEKPIFIRCKTVLLLGHYFQGRYFLKNLYLFPISFLVEVYLRRFAVSLTVGVFLSYGVEQVSAVRMNHPDAFHIPFGHHNARIFIWNAGSHKYNYYRFSYSGCLRLHQSQRLDQWAFFFCRLPQYFYKTWMHCTN